MAVLPLVRRRGLDASCLVLGAMAPDFEYFIHGQEQGNFGHTWLGVIAFDLPMTIALALLWHRFVKATLLHVVRAPVACALAAEARAPWPRAWTPTTALAIVLSALIGAATHLVWDGFTHAEGFAVAWWPDPFARDLALPGGHHLMFARALQYGFSLLGLAVVWWAARAAIARRTHGAAPARDPRRPRAVYATCMMIGAAAVLARALVRLHATDPGSLAVAIVAGALAGLLIATAVLRRLGYK